MNKKDWTEALLFAGIRIIAVMLILAGSLGLLFQLMESWAAFDPSYLRQFVGSVILRPLILLVTGVCLLGLSGRLARMLSRGHHS